MVQFYYRTSQLYNSLPAEKWDAPRSYESTLTEGGVLDEVRAALNYDNINMISYVTANGDIWEDMWVSYYTWRNPDAKWMKVYVYDSAEDYLRDVLPHGAGIDADWNFVRNGSYITAYNSYHVMNNGMYDGWVDFTVRLYEFKRERGLYNYFRVLGITIPDIRKYDVCDDEGMDYDDLPSIREYLNQSIEGNTI